MPEPLLRGFVLGNLEIRPLLGEIEGPAGVRHVQPKAMEVLVRLAREPGEVVSREALLNDVWRPGYPSMQPLTRCVSDLRQALDDDAHEPRFVQTLPKRGYRLLVTPRLLGGDEPDISALTAAASKISGPPAGTPADGSTNSRGRSPVFRVAAVYGALAWLLVQVAETVFPALGLPDWTLTFVLVLLALGFPLTLLMAWATAGGTAARSERHLGTAVSLALAGLVVSGGGAWLFLERSRQPADVPTPAVQGAATATAPTLAVLPFAGTSAGDGLADGLAEELTNRLMHHNALRVASWRSARYHAGQGGDVPAIAERLGVDAVLEGTVSRAGDQVTVAVSLADGGQGLSLWAETFTASGPAVSQVTREVAREVLAALGVVLAGPAVEPAPATGLEAYDLYLEARQLLREPKTSDTLDTAGRLLAQSVELDPRYAPARAAECELAVHRYRRTRTGALLSKAEAACGEAAALDPDFAETHAALGALYRLTGRLEQAEVEYRKALAAFPRLIEAQYGLGDVLLARDRYAEAHDAYEAAIAIDPSYWGSYTAMGHFLVNAGRGEEALPYYRQVVELKGDSADAWTSLGAGLMDTGRTEEAEAAFLRSLEIQPTVFAWVNLGEIYFGRRMPEAVEAFREAARLAPEMYWTWGELAEAAAFVDGEEALARDSLQRAIRLAEQATAATPADAMLHADLARYLSQAGRLDEALRSAERAAELAPRSPDAHAARALVLVRAGEMEGALEALEAAVALGYNPAYLLADPRWGGLQTEERFLALLDAPAA
jgi:tetratricopeptide (TPR) repeat protein/TolB-like protein/DNA-binding winged helix-turn-helix (wHTH) protein